MSQLSLEEYQVVEWLRVAYAIALSSPDPSTQNGAVVLNEDGLRIGSGCNEFTLGMSVTPDLLERPKKYTYIEHAERNALYNALKFATDPPDTIVVPWAACADCARAIVQTGVKTLIRHARGGNERWNQSIEDGDIMMHAAGVNIVEYEKPLGACKPILFNGELWTP